ncbi:MAG: hypothetical protein ACRDBO_18235 [Lachnospiraceae bacterium]
MKKLLGIVLTLVLSSSLSVTALAESSGNVTVNGSIQITRENPSIDPGGDTSNPGAYDITFDATVNWYVTENSHPAVWNGLATNPSNPNKIQNNSTGTAVNVSLKGFTGDSVASSIASQLTLNLTGDLAANGMGSTNLATDYSGTTNYTAALQPEATWTYGFSGSYSGTLSTTAVTPTYTMTLGFSF